MRAAFEAFIKQSPFEMSTVRVPETPEYAWPGQYKDNNTSLAWEVWVEAWNAAVLAAAKVCEDKAYSHKNAPMLGPEANSLDCAKLVNKMTLKP